MKWRGLFCRWFGHRRVIFVTRLGELVDICPRCLTWFKNPV